MSVSEWSSEVYAYLENQYGVGSDKFWATWKNAQEIMESGTMPSKEHLDKIIVLNSLEGVEYDPEDGTQTSSGDIEYWADYKEMSGVLVVSELDELAYFVPEK